MKKEANPTEPEEKTLDAPPEASEAPTEDEPRSEDAAGESEAEAEARRQEYIRWLTGMLRFAEKIRKNEASADWYLDPEIRNRHFVAALRQQVEELRFEDAAHAATLAGRLVELVPRVPVGGNERCYPDETARREDRILAQALLAEAEALRGRHGDAYRLFTEILEPAEGLDPRVYATVLMRIGACRLRLRNTRGAEAWSKLGPHEDVGELLGTAIRQFSDPRDVPAELYLLAGSAARTAEARVAWLRRARLGSFDGTTEPLKQRILDQVSLLLVQDLWFYPDGFLSGHLGLLLEIDLAGDGSDPDSPEDRLALGLSRLKVGHLPEALETLESVPAQALSERLRPWLLVAQGETLIRLKRLDEAGVPLENARKLTSLNDLLGQVRSEWFDGVTHDTLEADYTKALSWAARVREHHRKPFYPLGFDFVPRKDSIRFTRHFIDTDPSRHDLEIDLLTYDEAIHAAEKALRDDVAAGIGRFAEPLGFKSVKPGGDPQTRNRLRPRYLSMMVEAPGDEVVRCWADLADERGRESEVASVGFYLPRVGPPETWGFMLASAILEDLLVPLARQRKVFYPEGPIPEAWRDGLAEEAASTFREEWALSAGRWEGSRVSLDRSTP